MADQGAVNGAVTTNGCGTATTSSDVSGWADSVHVRVPQLFLRGEDEQVDFLLLAWALLLHRGDAGDKDDVRPAFQYRTEPLKNGVSSIGVQGTIALSNLFQSDDARISSCLDVIRAARQKSSPVEDLASGETEQSLYCSNIDSPETAASESSYDLKVRLREKELCLQSTRGSRPISVQQATIQSSAFADILQSVLLNQNQPVGKALRIGERELLHIWRWNKDVPPLIDRCMHDMFADFALRDPDRPAVVSWDGELTYGKVHHLSTKFAKILSIAGVKLGTLVPLCFEKSMWTIVAVLAVMKAGGGLILTDPKQPEARLQTISNEVNAQLVVTSNNQAQLGSRIAPNARILTVGPELLQENAEADDDLILQPVLSTAIMYIVFTSGSTGKPKGVVISHADFTSGALPRCEVVGYTSQSRVLDFPSYAFDVSFDCMLCTLVRGGCICVPSDEARINDLNGTIRGMKVNMAHMTPSVARVLESEVMESLSVLGLGGEPLPVSDAAIWSRKTKLVNAYGPSECTVGCAINNDIGEEKAYMSLGKGVGAVTWIVDPLDHNILTPIGGAGELLVEGPIVGRGYLNEPEETAQAFVEDPVWLLEGTSDISRRRGRLYKTGDLVKYDPDGSGCLVFEGRKDRQVKLRGQRVELAEVEHHLRRKLPSGTSVAAEVITPGGKSSEPTLVAFLAEKRGKKEQQAKANGDAASFSGELRKALTDIEKSLSNEIPIYMVPTAFIPLGEMPLMVSCKIDRKKLHEIGLSMSKMELSRFRAGTLRKREPSSDMERTLHNLWIGFFGDDLEIGVGDNYFALGGDSLKAMKLVGAARAEGFSLTVADIFTHPKLSEMALALRPIESDTQKEDSPFSLLVEGWKPNAARAEAARSCNIEPSLIEDIYPCTPLQEGFMALSAKVSEAYIAQRVVELKDIPTARKLQSAFETVATDCPILRTRIVQVPGRGLMQVIVNEEISWHSQSTLQGYLAQDRAKLMELGDPLVRFALINENETDKIHVVLTIHHAVYDGWSMPLIVDRVKNAYLGLEQRHPPPFKALIHYLNSIDKASVEDFWREQLQGANSMQFPVMHKPGYQQQANSLLEHYVTLSRPSDSNTTVATAIRGAWALVAAKYTATDDVVFGETLTGRNAPVSGIEEIEGPMITTVPIRVSIDRNARSVDYLHDIRSQTVSRIPYEHMGLQHIRRLSPDAREACELRTCLVLHPVTEDEVNPPKENPVDGFVPASDAEAAREALKFNSYALMLVCTLDPKGFLIMASFDSKLVDKRLMDSILVIFGDTVQRLCTEANTRMADLPRLDDQDQTDIWRFSELGAKSIASLEKFQAASETWIVDPADPEHLLPIGAVGELLIEVEGESSMSFVDDPQWRAKRCEDHAGQQKRLHKTNQLAKYNSDGSITLVHQRVVKSKPNVKLERRRDTNGTSVMSTTRGQVLMRLWSRILGIESDEISVEDSFFELGGDSIAAMKLVSELRLEGLKLTMPQIFQHRIFSDMIINIQVSEPSQASPESTKAFSALKVAESESFVAESIVPALAQSTWKVLDVLPVRPLQDIAIKGTICLPRFSARYELFYLDGAIDKPRLFRSCAELVARNEILRTIFVKQGCQYYGAVVESLDLPLAEYTTDEDMEAFARNLCDDDVQSEMPLGTPFVKFLYVQGTSQKSCLIFRISHAQYDEICLPALLHQLSARYEERPTVEAKPFSSFVYHVINENIPQSVSYWRDRLRGSSMTVLRPEPRPRFDKVIALSRTFDISARSKEITVATLPTAAWALCLARRLSLRDVTFGEVVSGRNLDFPHCDTVIGPCWQYIPVRVVLDADWSALDLLRAVQVQHIASARYEGIGLPEIVSQCTDWPQETEWYDSVVHQDVAHVETLPFTESSGRLETVYPHLEPLREWKVQAFHKEKSLCLEIVAFESYREFTESLLEDLAAIMALFMDRPTSPILDRRHRLQMGT